MTKALTYAGNLEKAVRQLGMPAAVHRRVTVDEVDRARELAGDDARLRLLIDFLWLTGARISEVLALKVEDIDWRGRSVSMPTLKRRIDDPAKVPRRGLPLPNDFLGDLAVYIRTRKGEVTPKSLIFPIKRIMAWRSLKRILIAAGVDPKRAFPHAFRHGHALHALQQGVPINVVQLTLGHTSLLTTQIYVRATGKDIQRAYDRVAWHATGERLASDR